MNNTLLRKGRTLLMGCLLLAACSKSATMSEMSDEKKGAPNRARISQEIPPVPYAPMPPDSVELVETRNPNDI